MASPIRILYLDDSDIDHRLMAAYLESDPRRSYDVTPCRTLEEALGAMQCGGYDALIIDNRMPPYTSYHEPYRKLKSSTGYHGPTLVVTADVTARELDQDFRQDHEIVLDKANLLSAIRAGMLATLGNETAICRPH
ncbi:MAG: hypothetical protein ACFB01_16420 [Cohaesibacteraceae bacterium]